LNLSTLFVFIQQLLLRKRNIVRYFQLVLQILFEEDRLAVLLILFLFMGIYGVLIEIVFGIEVSPYCKGENHCLLDPVKEAVSEIATLDVGVQTEEAAKRNAPFN
jgi:hypothetical protein